MLTPGSVDQPSGITQSLPLNVVVAPPAQLASQTALPNGWTNQDVGSTGYTGVTTYSNGVFELQGSGGGALHSQTIDEFRYAFAGLQGDGSIVARLLMNQNSYAEAGVIIRDSLDPAAAYVMFYEEGNNLYLISRSSSGAQASLIASGSTSVTLPVWLKLERQLGNYVGFTSADGISWVQVGNAIQATIRDNCYIGLMDSATSYRPLNTAIFDSVDVESGTQGFTLSVSNATPMVEPARFRLAFPYSTRYPRISGHGQLVSLWSTTQCFRDFHSDLAKRVTSSTLGFSGSGAAGGAYPLTISATD